MAFSIPNELLFEVAKHLPARDLSVLGRTNSTFSYLLTPLLLRRAEATDVERCIISNRPESLRAILYPATPLRIAELVTIPATDITRTISSVSYATRCGNFSMVRTLLELGEYLDHSAFLSAVKSGNIAAVDRCIDYGADVNGQPNWLMANPCTALACAANSRYEHIAHLLLSRGAQLDGLALAFAAHRGILTVVNRMLDLGLPVDALIERSGGAVTALQYMCGLDTTQDPSGLELLVARGADVNRGMDTEEGEGSCLPLMTCVILNQVTLARVLLEHGARWDARCWGETTMVYLRSGSREMKTLFKEYM